MNEVRPQTWLYIGSLAAIAAISMFLAVGFGATIDARAVWLSIFLTVVLGAAVRKPLPFGPHTHLMLDTAVVLAAVLLLPSGAALIVAAAGPALANAPRRDWSQTIFNAAQTALQAASAAATLALLGWDRGAPFQQLDFLVAIPAAGLVMHLANSLAIAGIIAVEGGRTFRGEWKRVVLLDRAEALGQLSQWGLALLAVVIAGSQAWALLLLVLPGTLVLSSLDRHARLRVRAEEQLVHLAYHDPLTGLPNRAKFTESLARSLSGDGAHDVALLFLDLDRFKLINDTMGHEAGDQLLVTVADRLRAAVRPEDLVARLGGDEFVVLVENAKDHTIESVTGRIITSISAPVEISGREITITASVGAARPVEGGQTGVDLLRDADIALYRAKENGRNRIAIFSADMGAVARERMEVEADLRSALHQGGLWVTYQPQIEVAGGQTIALEALVRWDHPVRGLLHPAAFLPVAEETGLIVPLGELVMREACRAAAEWSSPLADSTSVAINIGTRQLVDPGLLAALTLAVDSNGLQPDRLRLEIAESAVMADPDATLPILARLADMGAHLVLDDFGSGRSGLALLSQLPVKTLALDRTLVMGVGKSAGSDTVVRAITAMARELGLAVAAKGVERPEQLALLRDAGCTLAQGDLFAPPLSRESASIWLSRAGEIALERIPGSSPVDFHRDANWVLAQQTAPSRPSF